MTTIWHSDRTKERGFHAAFGGLSFYIHYSTWFRNSIASISGLGFGWLDITAITSFGYQPWGQVRIYPQVPLTFLEPCTRYFAACLVASWPYTHPLNIAWMSENTGSIGKRTIASGAVIGFANIYGGMSLNFLLFNEALNSVY